MSADNSPTLDDYASAVQNVANQKAEDRSHLDSTLGQIIGQWGGAGEQIGSAIKAVGPWVKSAYRIAKTARSTARALSTKDPQDIRNAKNDLWNAGSELISTAAESAAPAPAKKIAKSATKAAVSTARMAFETKGTPEYEDAQKQAASDIADMYPDGNTTKTFFQAASGDREALNKVATKFSPQVGKVLANVQDAHDSYQNLKNGVVDEYAKRTGQLSELEAKSQGITQRLQNGQLTPQDRAVIQQHIQEKQDLLHQQASDELAKRGYNVSAEFSSKLANGTLGLDDLHKLALQNTIQRSHPELLSAVSKVNEIHQDFNKIQTGNIDDALVSKYGLGQLEQNRPGFLDRLQNQSLDDGDQIFLRQHLSDQRARAVGELSDQLRSKGFNVDDELINHTLDGNVTPDDIRKYIGLKEPQSYIPSVETLHKSVSSGLRTLNNPHATILADALDASNGDADALERFKGHLVDQLPTVHKEVTKSFLRSVDVLRSHSAEVRQEAQRIADERAAKAAAATGTSTESQPTRSAPSTAAPPPPQQDTPPPRQPTDSAPPPTTDTPPPRQPTDSAPPPTADTPAPRQPADGAPPPTTDTPPPRQPTETVPPPIDGRPPPSFPPPSYTERSIPSEAPPVKLSTFLGRLTSSASKETPPGQAPPTLPPQNAKEPKTLASRLFDWLKPSKTPSEPNPLNEPSSATHDPDELERFVQGDVVDSNDQFNLSKRAAAENLDKRNFMGSVIDNAFQSHGVSLPSKTNLDTSSSEPASQGSRPAFKRNQAPEYKGPQQELTDFSQPSKRQADDDGAFEPRVSKPEIPSSFDGVRPPRAPPLPPASNSPFIPSSTSLADEIAARRATLKPAPPRPTAKTTDGTFSLEDNADGTRNLRLNMTHLDQMAGPVIRASDGDSSSVQFGQTGSVGTTEAVSSGDQAAGTTPELYVPPVAPSKEQAIFQGTSTLGVAAGPAITDGAHLIKKAVSDKPPAKGKGAQPEKQDTNAKNSTKTDQEAAAQTKRDEEAAAQAKRDQAAAAQAKQDQAAAAQAKQDEEAAARAKQEQDAAAQAKQEQDAAAQAKQEQDAAAQAKQEQDAAAQAKDSPDGAAERAEQMASQEEDIENAVASQKEKDEQAEQLDEDDADQTNNQGTGNAAPDGQQAQVNEGNPFTHEDSDVEDDPEDGDGDVVEGRPNVGDGTTLTSTATDGEELNSALQKTTEAGDVASDVGKGLNDATDVSTGIADSADGNVLGAVLNFGMLGASTALTALGIEHTAKISAPPPPVVAAQQVPQTNSNDLFNPDADSVNAI